ncbi:YciI family protein [Paraflavitalea sp. CAU 1676]|uniref:YciI family protein n=1 Tax=Paraflavitalea sp. CAU 1676 TaxID=3032598 RepID=UPI0023DA54ED|nr:YciI family protein [Paraflavitalea sp. CAU 1676]MDF2189474.1 YciI family protein [Paraflavitalea sp. CAU 1676]
MKEFMFIFKGPTYEDLTLSAEEAQANMHKWINWVQQLKTDGVYVEGRPLMKGGKVIAGKTPVVTDGPFAESKELVGGYFIIKAMDIDEALAHAKGFPDFALQGSVEVREVQVIPGSM